MYLYIYNGSNASFIKGYRFHSVITALKERFQLALHFSSFVCDSCKSQTCTCIYLYLHVYVWQMIMAFISQMVVASEKLGCNDKINYLICGIRSFLLENTSLRHLLSE